MEHPGVLKPNHFGDSSFLAPIPLLILSLQIYIYLLPTDLWFPKISLAQRNSLFNLYHFFKFNDITLKDKVSIWHIHFNNELQKGNFKERQTSQISILISKGDLLSRLHNLLIAEKRMSRVTKLPFEDLNSFPLKRLK